MSKHPQLSLGSYSEIIFAETFGHLYFDAWDSQVMTNSLRMLKKYLDKEKYYIYHIAGFDVFSALG